MVLIMEVYDEPIVTLSHPVLSVAKSPRILGGAVEINRLVEPQTRLAALTVAGSIDIFVIPVGIPWVVLESDDSEVECGPSALFLISLVLSGEAVAQGCTPGIETRQLECRYIPLRDCELMYVNIVIRLNQDTVGGVIDSHTHHQLVTG